MTYRAQNARWVMLLFGMAMVLAGSGTAVPARAQQVTTNGVGTAFELEYWQGIAHSENITLYEGYLARYPNGTFSEIARAKIAELRAQTSAPHATGFAAPPVTPVVAAPPVPLPSVPPPPPPPAPEVPVVAAPVPEPVRSAPQMGSAVPVAPAVTAPVAPPVVAPAIPEPVVARAPAPAQVAPAAVAQAPVEAPSQAAPHDALGEGSTLANLLRQMACAQTNGGSTSCKTPSPPQRATAPTPNAATSPAPATTTQLVAPATPVAGYGGQHVDQRLTLPAAPTLLQVPAVNLPPSFCSAEARNAFHDSVYAPTVAVAKVNNDAAAAYLRQLQALYDQYQLSHDPDTQNAIAAAAHSYEAVAHATFDTQSALVRQFSALMAVPIVDCAPTGPPPPPPPPPNGR